MARTSRQSVLLTALAGLLAGCITRESETATRRCRASTTAPACETCCTVTAGDSRTNVYAFNAPGDCRCVLRAWIFLQ